MSVKEWRQNGKIEGGGRQESKKGGRKGRSEGREGRVNEEEKAGKPWIR